jgi:hypothetical protein
MAYDATRLSAINLQYQGYANLWQYDAEDESFSTVAADGYFDGETRVKTGDKLYCTTSTDNLSFSGTFRTDDSGETVYVDWDRTLFFETQMADVSAASTVWFSVPPVGVIVEVYGTQWSAVTAANAAVAFSIGASAITGGSLTVLTTGVAGSSYSATPTAANVTNGTSAVKAVSDGASSTTAIMTLGFKIICPAQV